MRLDDRTLEAIAGAICGNGDEPVGKHFPYRSSSYLTEFFRNAGFAYVHKGGTRKWWVLEILQGVNLEAASVADLPSDSLLEVLAELFDPDAFLKAQQNEAQVDRESARVALNAVLGRKGLVGTFDNSGRYQIHNDGSGASSTILPQRPRPLSPDQIAQRQRLTAYLDTASEDEFTENVLVPLFQKIGFHRVSAAGHKEKTMEFGKDLWMKFQLPTNHWIYFGAQVKRVKIDSKGVSKGNVTEVLNQARMAIEHPIFDADTNRSVLLDHLFIISAAEITRQAKSFLIENLDKGMRRHIIFMDRDEFLDHTARIVTSLPQTAGPNSPFDPNSVPF
jgi:hypothetical protein